MNGIDRIQNAFRSARAQGRAALIPYYSLGYPDPTASLDVVRAIAAGADLIELGVPFSDPLADGPTIQYSTQIALQQGISVARCLEMAAELRRDSLAVPMLLMGYTNPILAYGLDRFVADSARSGVDGLIVPDLPPEEGSALEAACQARGLALVYMLSPDSPPARVELVAARTTGFLYLASVSGVTGARHALADGLPEFIDRARRGAAESSGLPVAVGFGISTPAQAARVSTLADGVIVGSALIDAVRTAVEHSTPPAAAAGQFISSLRAAMDKERSKD